MKFVYSEKHKLHDPPKEFNSNQVLVYGESPERAELIYNKLINIPEFEYMYPARFNIDHVGKVHSAAYVNYLQNAYHDWVSEGLSGEGIMPEFFAIGHLRGKTPPANAIAKAGYFMTDHCSMIVEGTWEAVESSAFVALTGAKLIMDGEKYAFSLCRPPGHHAGYDFAGGYCFLNNAALAAKYLQDNGELQINSEKKVGIFDIDFHHGNGTQDIVRHLKNILFISIHGHPYFDYPYFTGYVTENSANIINYPLLPGTNDDEYFEVFKGAVKMFKEFGITHLVVSLGVDTFVQDHLGSFNLTAAIYERLSDYITRTLDIPVLIVMEGGYNNDSLAANVVSFLKPFVGFIAPAPNCHQNSVA